MTREQLQEELKKKIKAGIKPSDIKKGSKKPAKTPKSPSPIEIEKDLGYESDNSIKIPTAPPLPKSEAKQIKQLRQDVSYWTTTAQTHLTNLQLAQARITNLEEQLKNKKPAKSESELLTEKNKQIEIIAKENEKNEQKAKKATELLEKQSTSIKNATQLIKEQAEKIKKLEKQAKNPAKDKQKENYYSDYSEQETKNKFYLFTCDICQQNKKSQLHLAKVNGLGINPTKLQKICDYCLKRVDLIQEPKEDFF